MSEAITLPLAATMADYQRYVHQLEEMHGWLEVDLVHNGFLMTEEVGELFKAIRQYERLYPQQDPDAGQPDAGQPDAGQPDAGQPDAGQPDAGQPDAGQPDAEQQAARQQARAHAAEEIVDVLNYLLAIANRLDVDVEQAFRDKNARNQKRTWG